MSSPRIGNRNRKTGSIKKKHDTEHANSTDGLHTKEVSSPDQSKTRRRASIATHVNTRSKSEVRKQSTTDTRIKPTHSVQVRSAHTTGTTKSHGTTTTNEKTKGQNHSENHGKSNKDSTKKKSDVPKSRMNKKVECQKNNSIDEEPREIDDTISTAVSQNLNDNGVSEKSADDHDDNEHES